MNLPGWPSSAMSETPGLAPPMFIRHRRTARPIEALARCPGPSAPNPPATPHAVGERPADDDERRRRVRRALRPRTGRTRDAAAPAGRRRRSACGRDRTRPSRRSSPPVRSWSTAPSGPITPRLIVGSAPVANTHRSTRSRVGMTTGSPSVHPRRCSCSSASASSTAVSTLMRNVPPPVRCRARCSPRSTAMIRGASVAASRAIASSPLPATGWGSRRRGTIGHPVRQGDRVALQPERLGHQCHHRAVPPGQFDPVTHGAGGATASMTVGGDDGRALRLDLARGAARWPARWRCPCSTP